MGALAATLDVLRTRSGPAFGSLRVTECRSAGMSHGFDRGWLSPSRRWRDRANWFGLHCFKCALWHTGECGLCSIPHHARDTPTETPLKLAPLRTILWCEQCHGDPLATHPTGATDTVREELRGFREFDIDNGDDIADIDSPGRDIRGEENGNFAGAKIRHHLIASVLREIPLQRADRVPGLLELSGEFLYTVFGSAEDDDRTASAMIENVAKRGHFVAIRNVVSDMFDRCSILRIRINRNRVRIVQMLLRSFAYPIRERGGKERSLAIRGGAGEDALNIRSEPTVEHFIGFVQHEEANFVQPEGALVQEIEHATGSTDNSVDTAAKHVALRTEGLAAIDQSDLDTLRRGQKFEHGADLHRKFARRSKYDHLNAADAGIDALDRRDTERECFTGAGSGLTDQIAAVKHRGDGA